MKKWDGPSSSWSTPDTTPFFLPPEDPYLVLLRTNLHVVVFYYYRTYYKSVCAGGWRIVEDMCYSLPVRRALACVARD